jgi:DNA-binding transcriptional LysR family regulator
MIRGIECLLMLEETHHFGAAAKKLGMSQPSLSQCIAALERELDIRLVVRGRNFEGFTPAGEAVTQQGRRVLRSLADLREMVDRCRPDARRRFVIGIIPITTFVAPLLSALVIEQSPAASLVVEVGDIHFVARGIRERKLDAGIVYLVPEMLRDMVQYALYEETYCLVSPARDAGSPSRPVTWAHAATLPLALLSPEMLNRRLVDKVFEDLGLKPTVRLEGDSILSLLTHVESGLCSAIVPRSSISSLPGIWGLSVRQLVEPVVKHSVGLVMLKEVVATPWGQQLDALFRSPAVEARFRAFSHIAAKGRQAEGELRREGV